MPICGDPQATAVFSLAIDKDKPDETRPEFICKFLTARERRKVRMLTDQAFEEKDDAKAGALMDEALSIGIVGWRNYPGEFNVQSIPDVLSEQEQWELLYGYPGAVSIAERDRKGPASPPPSAGDSSAETVATASAKTAPAK